MKIVKFEDLEIWKDSLEVTKIIYDLTANIKFKNDFALRDQIRRAVISISSNTVEGFEKNNNNEFIRYLKISKGSTGEVRNQLYIAKHLGYISNEEFEYTNKRMMDLSCQIGKLITYLENKRRNKEFLTR